MSITMEIADADFDKIKDVHTRQMIENAYHAISMTEGGWDYMKNFNEESFMFSSNPMIRTISDNMEKLGYNDHSGASFGWTMRYMEYLAKNGKDAFIASFEN